MSSIIKKALKLELLLIIILVLAGLIVRTVNFKLRLDFSTDQAVFATKALEIFREKKLTLLGPTASFIVDGRRLFQGSVIFYMDLVFLWLGNFDPIKASYAFTIFATLMTFPLYFGVRWLINTKAALFVSILYALAPFIVNYTRFLWNINFQLALTPLLIFSMGLNEKTQKKKQLTLIFVGTVAGFLTMFHYQYVVVDLILLFYYWLLKKIPLKQLFLFFLGAVIGFLPMIAFELRHNFYTLQTLIFFLNNKNKFFANNLEGSHLPAYYFISIAFVLFVLLLSFVKLKLKNIHLIGLFVLLLVVDLYLYLPKPANGFGMAANWNYPAEEKTHQLIVEAGVANFNVVNLGYDTLAEVQKYLLRKDGIEINFEDYFHNDYLFVIAKDKNFIDDQAYEISSFKPFQITTSWQINDYYSLYLLKKIRG